MIHLTRATLDRRDRAADSREADAREADAREAAFPFGIPVVQELREIRFERPVTIFVGENGSGKSTVLEALAIAARAITAGSAEAHDDETLAGVRALADRLKLTWATRKHRGFYLRAEDFFGFARRMTTMRAELEADLARVDREYADASDYARALARTPFLNEIGALESRYGAGLDARSHGEAFLAFFQARLVPGGTYFLDEPEAPLSPSRQLSFLALLREMVTLDCQVVMATHAPILLAYPDADIRLFEDGTIRQVAFDDLEHVRLTRDFLANPEAFLRYL